MFFFNFWPGTRRPQNSGGPWTLPILPAPLLRPSSGSCTRTMRAVDGGSSPLIVNTVDSPLLRRGSTAHLALGDVGVGALEPHASACRRVSAPEY